jgi:UDP-N-acetylglucosamine 4,6-dehydratase/5-epimerase
VSPPDSHPLEKPLEQGFELVYHQALDMEGGEIYVKKSTPMTITDIAASASQDAVQKTVGIRPREKLHEQMVCEEDAPHTYEYPEYFKILPAINNWSSSAGRIKDGVKVPEGFTYTSDNNAERMSREELEAWIAANDSKIGAI